MLMQWRGNASISQGQEVVCRHCNKLESRHAVVAFAVLVGAVVRYFAGTFIAKIAESDLFGAVAGIMAGIFVGEEVLVLAGVNKRGGD